MELNDDEGNLAVLHFRVLSLHLSLLCCAKAYLHCDVISALVLCILFVLLGSTSFVPVFQDYHLTGNSSLLLNLSFLHTHTLSLAAMHLFIIKNINVGLVISSIYFLWHESPYQSTLYSHVFFAHEPPYKTYGSVGRWDFTVTFLCMNHRTRICVSMGLAQTQLTTFALRFKLANRMSLLRSRATLGTCREQHITILTDVKRIWLAKLRTAWLEVLYHATGWVADWCTCWDSGLGNGPWGVNWIHEVEVLLQLLVSWCAGSQWRWQLCTSSLIPTVILLSQPLWFFLHLLWQSLGHSICMLPLSPSCILIDLLCGYVSGIPPEQLL